MKETLYLNNDLALVNFSAGYATTGDQLLNSSTFSNYVHNFIDYLKENNEDLYYYAVGGKTAREATVDLLRLFRMMRIFKIDEIESSYLNDKGRLLEFLEEMYNFWKKHQRFSVVTAGTASALQDISFVTADSNFNNMVLTLYRNLEESLMGRKNRVYRQMQAGTNAAIAVSVKQPKLSNTYDALKDIPFITSIMLRTPMILHPKSNKRTGMFTETDVNPITPRGWRAPSPASAGALHQTAPLLGRWDGVLLPVNACFWPLLYHANRPPSRRFGAYSTRIRPKWFRSSPNTRSVRTSRPWARAVANTSMPQASMAGTAFPGKRHPSGAQEGHSLQGPLPKARAL